MESELFTTLIFSQIVGKKIHLTTQAIFKPRVQFPIPSVRRFLSHGSRSEKITNQDHGIKISFFLNHENNQNLTIMGQKNKFWNSHENNARWFFSVLVFAHLTVQRDIREYL